MSGTAGGCRVDLGKNRQQKYRLDHHNDSGRAFQVRNNDVEKELNRACSIDRCSFLLFVIQRFERGVQDQKSKREPFPGNDNDNRSEWVFAKPVNGVKAKLLQNEGNQSVNRMHDEIL